MAIADNDKDRKIVKLSVEEFFERSLKLIERANERNIHLRMLGAAGVCHCLSDSERERDLFVKLGRIGEKENPFTDLDLIGYKKE